MVPSLLESHLDGMKEHDQEFNDHFAPIYNPEQEKHMYVPQMNLDSQNGLNLQEGKPLMVENNPFFLLQQKHLLQRELNQNQRAFNEIQQKQMKNVMSEPKFFTPGFSISVSNPNLRQNQGVPVKNEANVMMNNLNQNENENENESNGNKRQKGNVKNTYIKKINSLMNLSRVEDTHNQHPPSKHEKLL